MTIPASRRVTPAEFWDGKILGWEESRYARIAAAATPLEAIAAGASSSLRFRLHAAVLLLAPHLRGRRLVELGCGSGLLAEPLMALGAASYTGIDISPVAITRARERVAAIPEAPADIRFAVGSVADLEPQGDALTFSLGLFDWLTDAEIAHILAVGAGGPYLHAVAERRWSAQQLAHRLYVYLSYGRRTGYAPRYHTVGEIAAAIRRSGGQPPNIFRDRRLSFGVFVTDLPLPPAPLPDPAASIAGRGR